MEFLEAGRPGGAAEEGLEGALAVEGVDPFAHGIGDLAEPGVEDVQDRLAGILENAFFETFDEALLEPFLEGKFFEEGDVGHGFVG